MTNMEQVQKTYKNIIQMWNNAVANQDIKLDNCPYADNVEQRILKDYDEKEFRKVHFTKPKQSNYYYYASNIGRIMLVPQGYPDKGVVPNLNTVQKDIVQRYNINNTNKLDSVIRYMFDNIGNETSLRNIERGLKSFGYSVSAPTIDTYLKGLLDSYLLYKCEQYDIKGKRILNTNSKYYVADIGLRNAILNNSDRDFGHILENVVYLELIRRGYKVNVGKCYNAEVDFVATKNNKVEYYQVALNVLNDDTLERELASLEKIKNNYPKFLLTTDLGEGENEGIKRINVFDWLLED